VKLDAHVSAVQFSPDGKRLAIGTGDSKRGRLHLIEAHTGKALFTTDFEKPVIGVTFSPDGRWLAAVGGGVKVLDASSGKEVAAPQHRYYPSCAAFSPDGTTLATSGAEIRLWEVGTWKQRDEYTPDRSDEFRSIAWAPDSRSIVVAGARAVFLWIPRAR
jgi:WD40 repeat protein